MSGSSTLTSRGYAFRLPPIYDSRKRILVTGGAGFLGSHLIDRLLGAGPRGPVRRQSLHRRRSATSTICIGHPRFEFMRHDVTFPLYVEVDEIYNLACPASPIHYQHDPVQTTKTWVHGAINMLGLAKRLKCKILQASTSEVYGDPAVHPQTEDYWGNVNPIGPRSCYDEGKRCAETLFFDYHRQHGLPIKVARIFNTYGPRMHPQRRPRGVELHRPGAEGRADHHLWRRQPDPLLLLCRRPGRRADAADGQRRRRHRPDQYRQSRRVHHPRSWPRLVLELTGSQSRDRLSAAAAGRSASSASPISPGARLLGWEPKVPLREGLGRTIAYFRQAARRGNRSSARAVLRGSRKAIVNSITPGLRCGRARGW